MKAVIMAGGKGTRISSIASDIPKPMIKVCNIPVLEYEISCIRKQGFVDIIITVGYLANKIIEYFGDGSNISPVTGKSFGVHIEYFIEKKPLGNAGALYEIKDKLTEDFLLINADAIFNVDLNRFVNYHKQKGGQVTLFTHPNNHPYDSSIVVTDNYSKVIKWLSKDDDRSIWYKNLVNAGLHILSPKVLEKRPETDKVDLDKQILKPLVNKGEVYSYSSPEYIKDMGTPDRYQMVCNDFSHGLIEKKNLLNLQKAIFLDRDGTINKYVGFLKNITDFELIPGVSEAIKLINSKGYLAIVITNQPVIARGDVTLDELSTIHNKMETLLGKEGAYIDAIYYCPHHPDKGFVGEVLKYKINCECRKPKPGLILKAAKDYNIDLTKSWMIGDGSNDVECGVNAGCKTILIGNEKCKIKSTYNCNSLLEAVKIIFRGENNE